MIGGETGVEQHRFLRLSRSWLHQNELVGRALTADNAYSKKFPDDAPPFEHGSCVFYDGGDCSFSSYRLMETDRDDALAKTTVELSLTDPNRPSRPPYRWQDTVTLKKMGGRWVIDEVEYPDGKASDTLKAIIQDAKTETER